MKQLRTATLPDGTLAEIAAMYGVKPVSWNAIESGYRNVSYSFTVNDGRQLNFILYKREPESVALIERTNALGRSVAATGLPVRQPVDERILRVGECYGSLYSYLPGVTIPWEAYTMKHIKLLGYTLARFHTAASRYDGPPLPDVETVYEQIAANMKRYFANPPVVTALQEKLGVTVHVPDFLPLLAAAKTLSGRTVLHMDLVRSNVLFTEARQTDELAVGSVALSGILDLEKAAVGHPLFDIARTLAFLLVDCDKSEAKIRKYFLHSGYEKRGGRAVRDEQVHALFRSGSLGSSYQFVSPRCAGNAQPSQNSACTCSSLFLESLVTMFLIYDFYKFLRQNPYESLKENHHFIRTERMLRDRKVLQYSH